MTLLARLRIVAPTGLLLALVSWGGLALAQSVAAPSVGAPGPAAPGPVSPVAPVGPAGPIGPGAPGSAGPAGLSGAAPGSAPSAPGLAPGAQPGAAPVAPGAAAPGTPAPPGLSGGTAPAVPQPPAAEAPKAEAPKGGTPGGEGAKAEGPKAEAPKAEGTKAEAPKGEPVGAEGPKAESSAGEPLSPAERALSGEIQSELGKPQPFAARPLRQYGYDFFRPTAQGFPALTDVPIPPEYVLGPGDHVIVNVWGSVEGLYNLEVSRTGEITLPRVGTLRVWGMPFARLQEAVRNHLAKVFKDFQVNVNLGKLRSIRVYLVGEVSAPGGYNVSSLSTLINALSAAGGPTKRGSLRRIEVKRGAKVVETVDLYEFFLKGDKTKDVRLEPGDTILVPGVGDLAGIAGNVKRPAIYELLKTERTLKDLLVLADGIEPTGYLQRVQISRVEAHDKRLVTDVNLDPKASAKSLDELTGAIQIRDMDLVRLFPIDQTLRGYARLNGYALRPGDYALKPGMRVADILLPDNILPEFSSKYGELTRFVPPDLRPEVTYFDVGQALAGDPKHNFELQEFDVVRLFSRWEMEELPKVKISGEVQRPGEYRLLDRMTVRELVGQAGNLKLHAYLRAAEIRRIERDGSRRTARLLTIDLGEALKGSPSHNLLLEPEDELVVRKAPLIPEESFTVRVAGEVRRPGEYRLYKDMTIRDLLREAGDPIPLTAFLKSAELRRYESTGEKRLASLITVDLEAALAGDPKANLSLAPDDELTVRKAPIIPEPIHTVKVAGEVRRPGEYRLYKDMRIRDLLREAGDPVPLKANLKVAELRRLESDGETRKGVILTVNLEAALKGDPQENLLLEPDDELAVYKAAVIPESVYSVSVSGQVRQPGRYRLREKMTVRELLAEAGGPIPLRAYLKNAEISRISVTEGTVKGTSITVDLEEALRGDPKHDVELAPYDELFVRAIPDWLEETERYVTLKGEVRFPGTYPIYKGERLSSVVQRAGGFTEKAYLRGAKFARKKVQEEQQARMQEVIKRTEDEIAQKQADLAAKASSPEELEATKAALDALGRSLNRLKTARAEGRVVVRLAALERLKGGPYDVELMAGDYLEVPQSSNAVSILGEVYNPTTVLSLAGRDVKYYLNRAGGPTKEAEKDEMYVIRADGSVFGRQQKTFDDGEGSTFFGRWFSDPFMTQKLDAGDTVVVPRKLEKIAWMREIKDIAQIIGNLALAAGVLVAAGL